MADHNSNGKFAKGNQAAKDHGFGRPVVNTLERIEQYAKEFEEWSKQPSSIILGDFYEIHGLHPERFHEFCEKSSVFKEALKLGKARIAARRERLVHYNKLEKGVFNRYQGFFDRDLRDHERGEKEFEYRLKANLENKSSGDMKIEVVSYMEISDERN